ncbi:hypothetical protein D7Z26_09430 [Cohnella endophytica]|uniref:Intracellular proteinase inhibitor BsuPI domain-containing protein n=1 Tax=Cohnella endophytica TaxID=2419778 RepID=A0A494XY26_9BACL|nr:hypothetical protein [Cohnella endophytica]RKP55402.1 hypothetical protein D7Z26_09430 [Cohnella endophytica]
MKRFLFISLVVCFLLAGCGAESKIAEIKFGDWSEHKDDLLVNERSTFKINENITLAFESSDKFGTRSLGVHLYKASNSQLLDSWDVDVDPDWSSYSSEFQTSEDDELEPGEYEIAIFKDTSRIGEGKFTIE